MVAVLLTPLAAQMMARFDARLVASIAFAASAVSYFMRAELTAQADVWAFVLPLLVQGVSSATFFIALAMIVLDGIPPHRIPSATGLSNFVRIIASGFAASFVTTLWDRREAFHQSRLSEAVTATAPAFQDALSLLRGLGLGELQAKAAIGQKMVSQAYLLAALDIFHLSALISLVLVGAVWVCRRPARHGAVPTPLD